MSVNIDVDLRAQFGPVRDQGARPTCLAFAASDAHAAMRGTSDALSCEYAFYYAQKRAGRSPRKGAFLSDMLDALREDGQPLEGGWPYLTKLPSDLSTYIPPSSTCDLYGRNGRQPTLNVDRVCRALDDDTPSIVLSVLTGTFFHPPADGIINHIDGDDVFPAPRHAIVAVGYGQTSTGRAILIRNSWGPSWCLNGYGWVTETFLTRHMYDLALFTEERDVSHHSTTA